MSPEQRSRMIRLHIDKWVATSDRAKAALYKRIAIALGYGAGVQKVAAMSRQFKQERGLC